MDMFANNIIVKGGWVMIPIILGCIVAFGLTVERGMIFWKTKLDINKFSDDIFSLIRLGKHDVATETCTKVRHPIARVFSAGLEHRGDAPTEIERIMESTGREDVARLEKNMSVFLVIIGVEPMMGFLGTVIGLIQSFMTWEIAGASTSVEQLSGGIYHAMITTASGLIVAIPFYIIYNLYTARIHTITKQINKYGEELLGIIRNSEPKKGKKRIILHEIKGTT